MFFNVPLRFLFCIFIVSGRELNEIINLISDEYLKESVKRAELQFQKSRELQNKAVYLNPYVNVAEARHQSQTCPAYDRGDIQNILETITNDLVTRYNLSKSDVDLLRMYPLRNNNFTRQLWLRCIDERPVQCSNTKYASIDGSCNNLDRPNEGRTYSHLDRFVPPDYTDGVNTPRTCKKYPLPPPRKISIAMHRTPKYVNPSIKYSALLASFGQFLDHDIVSIVKPPTENDSIIGCCNGPPLHSSCFPIEIFPNDPDFVNSTCMNFVRNAGFMSCRLGWREQMNSLPPGLQCSQIYGSNLEENRKLRKWDGRGELAYRTMNVGELPLANWKVTSECSPHYPCFLTGDRRANQNLPLASLHITFFRMHNVLARIFKIVNPHWNEETLYQEARKLIMFIFQYVVYNEYLPLIIGPKLIRDFDLDKEDTVYNPDEKLTLLNAFSTAAFRLHSTISEQIYTITNDGRQGTITLSDSFYDMSYIYQNGIEDILRGISRQPAENFNPLITRALTKNLYRKNATSLGLDLAAINIQRGRDHGLPSYVVYVKYFHDIDILAFPDLSFYNLTDADTVVKLQNLYKDVECIDLFTGLSSERPIEDAVVGPTTAKIIAHQFHRLKFGFRHFYTHRDQLTPSQRATIKRTKLRDILCVANNMPNMTENVFLRGSRVVNCLRQYELVHHLIPWKE